MKTTSLLGVVLVSAACAARVVEARGLGWHGAPRLSGRNQISLLRREIAKVPSVGDISDMRVATTDAPESALLVSGTCGAFEIVLGTGQVRSEVKFELPCPPFLSSRIRDMDGDGSLEFVRFNTEWVGPTAVLERDGRLRWSVGNPGRSIDAFDSDGDGQLEVLVGELNSGNTWLIDCNGKQVWERTWEGTNFEVLPFDVDGDEAIEFLYTNGDGLQVYDRSGAKRFTTKLPDAGYVNALDVVDEGPGLESARLCVGNYLGADSAQGQWSYWYERDAKTVLGRSRPEVASFFVDVREIHRPVGHSLFLKTVECKEQAPIAGYRDSTLRVHVFDDGQSLVFSDQLSGRNEKSVTAEGAFLVLNAAPLRFLVGYADTLWEYTEHEEPRER